MELNYKFVGSYKIPNIPSASLDEVKEFLKNSKEFCLDTETTGLCPHKDRIIMVQVGNKDVQYIIDVRDFDITPILHLITDPSTEKIGANLKFEYKMFLGTYGVRIQNLVDVMIQEMVLTCGLKHSGFSLANLTKKYLDIELPKEVRLEFTRIGKEKFEERHIKYGAGDVIYPQLINDIQQDLIEKDGLLVAVRLENNVVKVMGEMEFTGMPVNTERWKEIADANERFAQEKIKQLDQYIIDNKFSKYYIPQNLFNQVPKCTIKWTSPKEVAKVFSELGIPTKIIDKEKTKKAEEEYGIEMEFYKDTIGGPELEQYAKQFPIIPIFLEYQKYAKASKAFGNKWLKDNINSVTGRVHSSFWQILNTGRSSSSKPNVQQIPSYKDKDFHPTYQAHRTCFEAPEGYKLVVKDYSGQESRVLAELSNESSMINEFVNGTGDLHSLTASKVYSSIRGEYVHVDKKTNTGLRQNAKTLNFAISYGAGAYKIAKGLKVSEEEAQKIIDNYYESFPMLEAYFKNGHKFIKDNGFIIIDPVTRRRSYFPLYDRFVKLNKQIEEFKKIQRINKEAKLDRSIWSDFYTLKGIMERISQNYRIQGLSASMTKIALVLFYQYLLEHNLFDKVEIILVLHDEIVVMAKDEEVERIDKVLTDCMLKAGKVFCKRIPMEVSGGPCTVWDH
jgi:DNA polymerase-1